MAEIKATIEGPNEVNVTIDSPSEVKATIQGIGPQGIQGIQGDTGATGPEGPTVDLQVASGQIQWKLSDSGIWLDLIALADLTGAQGEQGIQGDPGDEIELQQGVTHIQWRYVGDVSWTDLIAIADITGPQGPQGDPGTGEVPGGVDGNLVSINASEQIADSGFAPSDFATALGADDNYVTDAEKVKLSNLSGTNTGDQTLPVKASGAEVDTGTDDAKFVTPKAMEDSAYIKDTGIASTIHAASSKTTPVNADEVGIIDTEASNVIKRLTFTNLKAFLKTYFDTLYQAVGSYVTAAGFTLTGEIDLGENAGLVVDSALSADGKYSGISEAGTAGAALSFGDLCYLNNDDSRWEKVDANLSDGYDKKLGICVLAAGADGNATKMLLWGKIRADAAFPTLTIGAPVYMSETAGAIVVTQPSTADVAIRIIGFGNTADELFFNPSNDYIVHT